MRYILLAAIWPCLLAAAPGLEIVRPVVSDTDGGPGNPASFDYRPGQIIFFSCRVAGFAKTPEDRVNLSYTVQAFDPRGVPLADIYKNTLTAEVTPQDKEWLPKIETEIAVPPLVFSGSYKIAVKVEDVVAKTTAELSVPFLVRGGEDLEPSDTLVVRNFRFLRNENDTKAAERPAYRNGDHLWAKFDITGYKYGAGNHVDVTYTTSIIGSAGKTLWTQPEPAGEQGDSVYPKAYIPAEMGVMLQGKVKPGEYTLVVQVKDAVGNQSCEARQAFTVEN
jgi:hypothetical protein